MKQQDSQREGLDASHDPFQSELVAQTEVECPHLGVSNQAPGHENQEHMFVSLWHSQASEWLSVTTSV